MKLLPVTILLTVLLLPSSLFSQDRIEIQLRQGYNLISSNMHLAEEFWARDEGPDVRRMFAQLGPENNEHPIIIMRSSTGLFYMPRRRFNNIPYYSETQGLAIEMAENGAVAWGGVQIPADTEVPIPRGLSYIAYFPTYELDASSPDFRVLAPVIEQIRFAIDEDGAFMLPEWEFSNMAPWRPGRGYVVNATEDLEMQYLEEDGEGDELWRPIVGDHWQRRSCRDMMPVLVNDIRGGDIADGDMIAAFSDDLLVGCGTVWDGRCGITIFGENQEIEGEDGMRQNEEYRLVYWIAEEDREVNVEIVDVLAGDNVFSNGNFAVVVIRAAINAPPQIVEVMPEEFDIAVEVGDSLQFLIGVEDREDDEITYNWLLNNELISEAPTITIAFENPGETTVSSIVSDGYTEIPTNWDIMVEPNDSPEIIDFVPPEAELTVVQGDSIQFVVWAGDANDDSISYYWMLEEEVISEDTTVTLVFDDVGELTVSCGVTDGYTSDSNDWRITVIPNTSPRIIDYFPSEFARTIDLGDSIAFVVRAVDDEGDSIRYDWRLGEEPISEDQEVSVLFEEVGIRNVSCIVSDGRVTETLTWEINVQDLGISEVNSNPTEFRLKSVWPNPFNATTTISFSVPTSSQVQATIHDLAGHLVAELFSGQCAAGLQDVIWDAAGQPAGIYIIRLASTGQVQAMKVILIK